MAKKANKTITEINSKTIGAPLKEPDPPVQRFSLLDFRVQAVILGIICLVFYGNTFSHQSAFDDRMAISDNEYVQKGFAGIADILSKDAYQSYLEAKNSANQLAGGRYRPLSLITFAIEQQLMGVSDDADADAKAARIAHEMPLRHVVNVLLYMLSVIALLYLFRNIIFPGRPAVAFLAALLFTIHPIHTEVVANVKSRDEILSVLFIALTFIKAFRYKETLKKRDLIWSLVFFFLALLSKEYAMTLIVLLPLSFYVFKNEPAGFSLKTTLLYLIPVAAYLLLRVNAVTPAPAEAAHNVLNNPYFYATGAQKTASEIMVLLDYLKLLVYPDPLIADYSYRQIPYANFSDAGVWLSVGVYLALLAGCAILIRKRQVPGFAIAVYLLPLALVSNFVVNIGAPMGERLIYHSSVGFCIAIAWLLYKGLSQLKTPFSYRAIIVSFAAVLIIVSGYLVIQRNKEWKNDETLFLTDVKKAPNSVLLNNNAAAACMENARMNKDNTAARNEWFQQAIHYFDAAISVYPEYYVAYLNRGLCYFNMGVPDKALRDWDTVRKHAPDQQNLSKYLSIAGKYFFGQGMKYQSANRYDSAIACFSKSVDANPAVAEAWFQLGKSYFSGSDFRDAANAASEAMKIAPGYADAKDLFIQAVGVESTSPWIPRDSIKGK